MKYTNRRSDGCQQPTLCAAAPPTLQALRFAASRSCRLRSSMRLRTRDSTLDLFCILNSVACHAQFNLDMQPQQGGLPWDPPACLCPPASKVEALHGPTPLGLTPHAPLFLQPNSASDSHCVHCKQGGRVLVQELDEGSQPSRSGDTIGSRSSARSRDLQQPRNLKYHNFALLASCRRSSSKRCCSSAASRWRSAASAASLQNRQIIARVRQSATDGVRCWFVQWMLRECKGLAQQAALCSPAAALSLLSFTPLPLCLGSCPLLLFLLPAQLSKLLLLPRLLLLPPLLLLQRGLLLPPQFKLCLLLPLQLLLPQPSLLSQSAAHAQVKCTR